MLGVQEVRLQDEERGSRSGAPDGRPEGGREVRWSARRKEEVVLRLLRGESLDRLARESGQAAGTISAWREAFLAAGQEGLKTRPAPVEDVSLREAQRKIGEQAISNASPRVSAARPLSASASASIASAGSRETFATVSCRTRRPSRIERRTRCELYSRSPWRRTILATCIAPMVRIMPQIIAASAIPAPFPHFSIAISPPIPRRAERSEVRVPRVRR